MASTGAMAEFVRLSPSRKVLVFAVIGGALGLGYWRLVYQSLDEQVDEAQAEHQRKTKTRDQLAADLPRYEHLKTRLTKLREDIEKNQTALPKEAEIPAFLETLQRKIAESGAVFSKWTNRTEEPVESFVKVPLEIEMTGTFMQIKRFFASLIQHDARGPSSSDSSGHEKSERIMSIESLALNTPTVKSGEIILTAKFTAVTFRQEDKPATPDKPANGQPAAAGAVKPPGTPLPAAPPPLPATPSPATPSPPPLPTAAPAGAKASGEKAPSGSDRLKGGLQ